MRKIQKALAALLTAALGFTPVTALAAEDFTKEEVVYVSLGQDGAVQEINVVNIFDLPEAGRIVDHGAYESVLNMTTTDPIDYDGETAVIDAGAGRLYYEGKLKSTDMPWTVSIRYYLDGREYTAQELDGMSGALEIHLQVSKNPACEGAFFDG